MVHRNTTDAVTHSGGVVINGMMKGRHHARDPADPGRHGVAEPAYPLAPFDDLAAAHAWVTTLVQWYNHKHRHGAIGFITPAQCHAGLDAALLAKRSDLYEGARAKNPLRWKRQTRNWRRVAVVHLNPAKTDNKESSDSETQIEQPTAVEAQERQVA
jgi:hypothetical protein